MDTLDTPLDPLLHRKLVLDGQAIIEVAISQDFSACVHKWHKTISCIMYM